MSSGAPGFCRAAVLDFGARAPTQGRGPGLGWLWSLRGIACLTLPLLLLVTPATAAAAATPSCSTGEYQHAALVAGCTANTGSVSFNLRADQPTVVASFPEGASNISFSISADVEIDLQLIDDHNGTCLVGTNCSFSLACADPTDFCIESLGMRFYFSGDHTGIPGAEAVGISGQLGKPFSVLVQARADGQGVANYSHGSIYPCPWALPGCTACNDYTGCSSLEQPECDGSPVVRCDPLVTQTTGVCPAGLYKRSNQPIMGCAAGSSTVRLDLRDGLTIVEDIPEGLESIRAELLLDPGSQGNLELVTSNGLCVLGHGPDCVQNATCQTHNCYAVSGIFLSRMYVGQAEVIQITFTIPPALVWAVAVRSSSVGTATLKLDHGARAPCPAVPPGCAHCSDLGRDLTGCLTWETPQCDGSDTVVCLPSTTTSTTLTATTATVTTDTVTSTTATAVTGATVATRTTTATTTNTPTSTNTLTTSWSMTSWSMTPAAGNDTTTNFLSLLTNDTATTTTTTSASSTSTATEVNGSGIVVGVGTTLPTGVGGAVTTTITTPVPPAPPAQLDRAQNTDSTASGGTVLVIVIGIFLLILCCLGCCLCLFFCFRSNQEKSKRSKAKNRVVVVPYDAGAAMVKPSDAESIVVVSSDEECAPPAPPKPVADAPEIVVEAPAQAMKELAPIQPQPLNSRSPPPAFETQPEPPSPLKLLNPKPKPANLEVHSNFNSDTNARACFSEYETATVLPNGPPPIPMFQKKRLDVPADPESDRPRTPTWMQCRLTPTKEVPPPSPPKAVVADVEEEAMEVKGLPPLNPEPIAPTVVPFGSPSPSMSHCQPASGQQPPPHQHPEASSASAASGSHSPPARHPPRSYESPVLQPPSKARPEPLEGTGCSKAEASTSTPPSNPPRRSKSVEETDLSQPPSTACNSKASTSRLSASSNHSMLSPTETWLPPIPSLFNNPGDAPAAGKDEAPRPELPDSRTKMTPAAPAGPSTLKAQPPPPLPGAADATPLAGSVDLASTSPLPPPMHEPGVPGFMPPPFQPLNCSLSESAGLPLLC